jgi:hypothetical protein
MRKKLKKPAAELTVNIIQVNVICLGDSNGSARAIPVGGTEPYTYFWNTIPPKDTATASNLEAGIYRVTVTDKNGFSASAEVIISKESNIDRRFYPDKIILETYYDIDKPPIIRELPVTADNRFILNFLDIYLNTDEQRAYEIIIMEDPDFIEIEGKYYYVPEERTDRLTQSEIDGYLMKKICYTPIQSVTDLLDYQLSKYPDSLKRLKDLKALFCNKYHFYTSPNDYDYKEDHQVRCIDWVNDHLEQNGKGDIKNQKDWKKKPYKSLTRAAMKSRVPG